MSVVGVITMYYDELYHFGVPGMRWGIRRYQNKDGTLTEAGKRRQVRQINSIYRHLDKQGKQYVTAERNPPKRFTDYDEHSRYTYGSFIAYDKKKPVSVMTAWHDTNGSAAVSVMTRKDYRGKGYGAKAVKDGMKWLQENGIKRVNWGANVNNTTSIEMAKSLGFEYLRQGKYDKLTSLYIKDL